jgi:hypothetical protein
MKAIDESANDEGCDGVNFVVRQFREFNLVRCKLPTPEFQSEKI